MSYNHLFHGWRYWLFASLVHTAALTHDFMILGGLIIGGGIGLTAGRTPLVPLTGQFSQEYIGTASGAMETIKGVLTFVLPIAIAQWFQTNYNGILLPLQCSVPSVW